MSGGDYLSGDYTKAELEAVVREYDQRAADARAKGWPKARLSQAAADEARGRLSKRQYRRRK